MADEQNDAPETTGRAKGLLKRIGIAILLVLLAAGAAVAFGLFVFIPWLEQEPSPDPEIPRGAVMVRFDRANTTAVMPPNSNLPASLLMYQVSFLCSNQTTAQIVQENRAWFSDMLRELHSDHPREYLDNPMLRRSIQQQALTKANEILNTLQGGANPRNKIIKVLHEEFFVYDQ